MKVTIKIDEQDPIETHTDASPGGLCESVSILHHSYFDGSHRQRVTFCHDRGEITISVRYSQCVDFWIDFVNNIWR